MFSLFKKKKNSYGSTIDNYHSGDAKIEAMKNEFFKYYNQGEEVGALLGDEYYEKAFSIAREWVTKENTNRSFGCLAAAALKLGAFDREKLQIAYDTYKMLAAELPEYKEQLAVAESMMEIQNEGIEEIRKIIAQKQNK